MANLTDRDKRAFLVGYMAGGSFARKDKGDKYEITEHALMKKWIGPEAFADRVYLELQKAFITEVLGVVVDEDSLKRMAQNEELQKGLKMLQNLCSDEGRNDLVEQIRKSIAAGEVIVPSDDEDKL